MNSRRTAGLGMVVMCALVMAIGVSGCDGPAKDAPTTIGVSGTVTLDGVGLADATVTFLPDTLGQGLSAASGRTDGKGRYDLAFNASQSGAKAGSYKVVISTVQTNEDGDATSQEMVPEVYNRKTTLTADVSDAKREFDFELKSDAGPIPEPDVEE